MHGSYGLLASAWICATKIFLLIQAQVWSLRMQCFFAVAVAAMHQSTASLSASCNKVLNKPSRSAIQ